MLFFCVRYLYLRESRVSELIIAKHKNVIRTMLVDTDVDKIGNPDAPVQDQNFRLQSPFWVPGIYRCKRHYVQLGEEVGTHVHGFIRTGSNPSGFRAATREKGEEIGGG